MKHDMFTECQKMLSVEDVYCSAFSNETKRVVELLYENHDLGKQLKAMQAVIQAAREVLLNEDYKLDHAYWCKSTHDTGLPCDCDFEKNVKAYNKALKNYDACTSKNTGV